MQVTEIRKQNIQLALREYCERYGGQRAVAKLLDDVSPATISLVISGTWADISDEMWRKIAAQIGCEREQWNAVETINYKMLTRILEDAQDNALWLAVTGNAGTGKTFTCRQYEKSHEEVYYLSCDPDWTKRDFFQAALKQMRIESAGLNLTQMKQKLTIRLKTKEHPVLILDEADKLSDTVMNSFITLYNSIQYDSAVVMIATEFLSKRMLGGVKYNKKGFNELWSRVGRRCVSLKGVTAADIVEVCKANGIADIKTIDSIIEQSESDLRRVQRRVHAELKKRERK